MKKHTDLQMLYLQYINATTERERSSTFKNIADTHLPYILSRTRQNNEYDRQEVISKYNIVVLKALDKYDILNGALFKTYLRWCMKCIWREYFSEMKPVVTSSKGEKTPYCISVDPPNIDSIEDFNKYANDYYPQYDYESIDYNFKKENNIKKLDKNGIACR